MSERSHNAQLVRTCQDMGKMNKYLSERLNLRVAMRAETKDKDFKEMIQKEIDFLNDCIGSNSLVIQQQAQLMKLMGINVGLRAQLTDLTDSEVAEITALRYAGLHGKPLYTKKEVTEQYHLKTGVVDNIDRDRPV